MSEKDLLLEQLEAKHNLYKSKVVALPNGTTFANLKDAIKKYVMDTEGIEDDEEFDAEIDTYVLNSFGLLSGNKMNTDNTAHFGLDRYCEMEIDAAVLQEGYAMVSVEGTDKVDEYYHDMYLAIDEFLKQIAGNKCPHCGEEITGKGKFCANCGAALK